MKFSQWVTYNPIPGWQSKYRIIDDYLEAELQLYARATITGGFDLNLDLIIPTGYDCADLEKVGVNIEDRYHDASIFLGARLPAHWVRTVSLIIPVIPRDRAA